MDVRSKYTSDDVGWLKERDDLAVEGPWVERKRSCDARELARQISAFANGQPPGGLIVVGVDRGGELVGIEQQKAQINEILGSVRNIVEGSWEHRFVSLPGGDELLFVLVPFSDSRVVTRLCRMERRIAGSVQARWR